MKKMALLITAAFAASLFFAGFAAAQMGSPAEPQSGSQSEQMMQGEHMKSGQQQAAQEQKQQLSSEEVRQVQQQLQAQGIQPGPIDGIMGPKTSKAIREFQQQEGITASGQPDAQTLQALGVQTQGQEFMGVSPGFEGEQQKEQQKEEQKLDQQQEPMEPSQQQQQSMPPSGSPGAK